MGTPEDIKLPQFFQYQHHLSSLFSTQAPEKRITCGYQKLQLRKVRTIIKQRGPVLLQRLQQLKTYLTLALDTQDVSEPWLGMHYPALFGSRGVTMRTCISCVLHSRKSLLLDQAPELKISPHISERLWGVCSEDRLNLMHWKIEWRRSWGADTRVAPDFSEEKTGSLNHNSKYS